MTTTPTNWETLHQANTTDAGDQSDLAVVDIGLGRFIVAWTEQGGGPIGIAAGDDIVGQIFDAEGNAIGGELQLNIDWSVDNEDNPALATRPGGGVDKVRDFEAGKDSFWLDKDIFAAIGNKLGKAEFAIGRKAGDASDRIIFDEDTGRLFYDANGNSADGKLLFARLAKGASLDHTNFVMIDDLVV